MGKYKTGLKHYNVKPLGALEWRKMKMKYGAARPMVSSVDLLSKMPDFVGMMGNDRIGDCFDAALYHGDQARTLAQGKMITEPDHGVVALYSKITGYSPSDPNSDQGSMPVPSFNWLTRHGLPRTGNPSVKLLATYEVDPSNEADVLEAMEACGGIMLGIYVPQSLEDNMDATVWDYDPGNNTPTGGHEIFMGMHQFGGNYGVVSWGNPRYQMTPAFWHNNVNQCTACLWSDWVESTGKTPFGMTVAQVEAEMKNFG